MSSETTKQNIPPIIIRMFLLNKGITETRLGEQLGISRQAITNVIYGRTKSARVRKAIAAIMLLPVEVIWPDAKVALKRGRKPKPKAKGIK